MEKRYIDADLFKKNMDNTCDMGGLMYPVVNAIREYVKNQIDTQPTADVKPVKRGEWRRARCSKCGHMDVEEPDYCSRCGSYNGPADDEDYHQKRPREGK